MNENQPQLAKILLVEDEIIIATEIRMRLQNLGYPVLALTPSAEQALEKIPQVKPELVLMDIQLDGPMDGIEAARQILSTATPKCSPEPAAMPLRGWKPCA